MAQYKELIKDSFILINNIKNKLNFDIIYDENSEVFIANIEDMAKAFVCILNLLSQDKFIDEEIKLLTEEIHDGISYIIRCINNNKISTGVRVLEKNVICEMDKLEYLLEERLKYKIVVYGINEVSIQLPKWINDECQVAYYVSNNQEHQNKNIEDIEIISPQDLVEFDYDYLIITELELQNIDGQIIKEIVSNNQIFNYIEYLSIFSFYCSPEFFTQYYKFVMNSRNYNGVITGISYTQKGINENLLKGKFLNFAFPTQDLFYDYEMMKHALSFPEIKANVRYAIIGLCYYSFQYDLSKSLHKNRSNYYYKITGNYHNYELEEENKKIYDGFERKIKRIFKSNHDERLYGLLYDRYTKIIDSGKLGEFNSTALSSEEYRKCAEEVKTVFNKDYPLTVNENKEILKDYLDMLRKNNIKPIVVICPQTKLFQENISVPIRDEFYDIISEIKKENEFQLLDYFYDKRFEDTDFYDVSHINSRGSEKLTQLLNNDIEW